MSLKAIGKLLIGMGLFLLVYGLMMETSVSTDYGNRVVNIGLANDRLMYILIGGFIFVGGIILYGIFKSKQSKQDEINEQIERKSRRMNRRVKVLEASRTISENSKAIYAMIAKDFIFKRLGHAFGIAFLVTFISRQLTVIPSVLVWFFYALMLALMFRPMNHHKAISQGWLLAAIAMLIVILESIIYVIFFRDLSLMDIKTVILIGVFLIPAAVFYLVSKRFASKVSGQSYMA